MSNTTTKKLSLEDRKRALIEKIPTLSARNVRALLFFLYVLNEKPLEEITTLIKRYKREEVDEVLEDFRDCLESVPTENRLLIEKGIRIIEETNQNR